jgi:hypothetical protein
LRLLPANDVLDGLHGPPDASAELRLVSCAKVVHGLLDSRSDIPIHNSKIKSFEGPELYKKIYLRNFPKKFWMFGKYP